MRIDIITLFPKMFSGPFNESIISRAQTNRLVSIHLHELRNFTHDKHKSVDDTPYGGGTGMVLRVDVIHEAIETVIKEARQGSLKPLIILLTPQGRRYEQSVARELTAKPWLIFICGHYEGFDERIRTFVNYELSIGDYILTGGELPAMVIVDTVVRLLPGSLGKEQSHQDDSFEEGLLEYPQFTRPDEYNGMKVPEVLKSGNHALIAKWRNEQSLERTLVRRPDLLTDIKVDNSTTDKVE